MGEQRDRMNSFFEDEWPSFRTDADAWRKSVETSLRRLFRRELAHDQEIRALKAQHWIAGALRSNAPSWIACALLLAILLTLLRIAHAL